MILRISSHDGRASFSHPIVLLDCSNSEVVGSFRSLSDSMRVKVLIENLAPLARDLSATELVARAVETSETEFAAAPERLSLYQFVALIRTIGAQLRGRHGW